MAQDDEGKTLFLESREPNIPLSRYNGIRLLLDQHEVPIQESWDDPEIPELEEDRFFEVTRPFKNRPDLISLMFYGTQQLYWVIARANGFVDAFAETVVGKKLRIPDRENLFHTVLAK